jgi:hypothetical protein
MAGNHKSIAPTHILLDPSDRALPPPLACCLCFPYFLEPFS